MNAMDFIEDGNPSLTKQVTGVTVNNVKRSGGLGSTGK